MVFKSKIKGHVDWLLKQLLNILLLKRVWFSMIIRKFVRERLREIWHWKLNTFANKALNIEHFFRGIFSNVFYYEESNWKTLKKKFHGFSSFFKVFQVFSRFFKFFQNQKNLRRKFSSFLDSVFNNDKKKQKLCEKKKHICCSFCLKNTTRLWNPCLPTLGY